MKRPALLAVAAFAAAFFSVAAAHEGAPAHDMQAMWAAQNAKTGGLAVGVAAAEDGSLWRVRLLDGRLRVSHAADRGAAFGAETVVSAEGEVVRAEGQARPWIAAQGGVVAVAWSQALPKLFAGHVRFARSIDGGKTFSAPVTLDADPSDTGHGFANLALNAHGALVVAWLDSRRRAAADAAHAPFPGSSIFWVRSDDGGATFTAPRPLADHSCECCRIGIAIDAQGQAVAFWRHLFDGERDFALATLDEHPVVRRASEDHWRIDGCPHHGGDLALDGRGGRHVAWFSGSPSHAGLFYRRFDGDAATAPLPFGNADAQAGYPTLTARGDAVWLAWREFDGERYRVLAMPSADRGAHWAAPRELAHTAGAADIPLFVAGAATPLIAWNTARDGLLLLDAGGAP